MVDNPPANMGDEDLTSGSSRYSGEGDGNLPVFLLGKPHGQRTLRQSMGSQMSWTQLSDLSLCLPAESDSL